MMRRPDDEASLPPWTRELLAVLTERERRMIVLHESGQSYAMIAEWYELTPSRISQLVVKARRKMIAAAKRGVLVQQKVPAIEPHPRLAVCPADLCKVPEEMMEVLDLPVSILSIGVRATRCFENAKIELIGDLLGRSSGKLLRLRNMGRKTLREVEEALAPLGLHLRMDTGDWKPPG